MPVHDWTRAEPGTFHSFHHRWISAIADALNLGVLPKGCYAMAEKFMGVGIPDVLALTQARAETVQDFARNGGGTALLTATPRTKIVAEAEDDIYAHAANRVVVRYRKKAIIAAIEIVSPGNKTSRAALEEFVEKSVELVRRGIHLMVIDVYPPTRLAPAGIHKAIWDSFNEAPCRLPAGKNRLLASYDGGPLKRAFVEPFGVGARLRDMPLFLLPGQYVNVPLESTYQESWRVFPEPLRAEVA